MLYLISLGLNDEKDMSIKALETAKKCDELFLELYTTGLNINIKKLSKFIGKEVVELKRECLEEKSIKILNKAKSKHIGVLIGGDALTATTHISLLTDAKKLGVQTKVIHGSSIYTAVCITGLNIYKFGRTTTLPNTETQSYPMSVYDIIYQNKKIGLHSLVLLDTGLNAKRGLNILLDMETRRKEGLITEDTGAVVCCKLGSDEEVVKYGKVKDLSKNKEIEKTPAVIIIPGELHFMEKEMLEYFR